MTAFRTPDQQALAPYLEAKDQAEKCLQIIASSLQPGMSEADCQHLIRDWLRAQLPAHADTLGNGAVQLDLGKGRHRARMLPYGVTNFRNRAP